MSAGAKLFITLCKQTLSWTACRRGVRGGGRGVACEVRQGCERRCSLTPITLPLISPLRPLCSLLLTHRPPPHHHRPPPLPRTWGSARAAKRSLHFLLLFFLLSLFLLHFLPPSGDGPGGSRPEEPFALLNEKCSRKTQHLKVPRRADLQLRFQVHGIQHVECLIISVVSL